MNTTSFCEGGANKRDSGTGIMLFGVRLTEGSSSSSSSSFRKSASMNSLLQLDHAQDQVADVATGYASDDLVHASVRGRDRKRGTPWTEEEHRLFLMGLQLVGKGDWRGISRNFVKSRTPTQVASHAQKYFLRQNNHNRRRRRSSLFDITSDTVTSSNMEEDDQVRQGAQAQVNQSVSAAGRPLTCPLPAAPVSSSSTKTLMDLEASPLTLGQPGSTHSRPNHQRRHHHTKTNSKHIRAIPIPPSAKLESLNLNTSTIHDPLPLSLKVPKGSVSNNPVSSSPSAAFQGVPQDSLNSSGDSMISVA